MNKVIITGATSMLGIALLDECIKNGVYVYAVVRPNSKRMKRIPKSKLISIIECDINELSTLKNKIKDKCDIFYHFAWQNTGIARNINLDKQISNINFILDAVNSANSLGCKKFIWSGSQAEYGRIDKGVISPETNINPETAYGICKYTAGKLAEIECERLGMEYIWTRVFSVYGPNDKESSMIMTAISKMLRYEETKFTKGEQTWDYLYSKDAGNAFYLLGLYGKDKEVYCIGSGYTKHIFEYIKIVRDSINPKVEVGIGKIPYPINTVMNLCADIKKLEEHTGFKPMYSFEEGISETIKWYREVYEV